MLMSPKKDEKQILSDNLYTYTMKEIIFATGNQRKLIEAESMLAHYAISIQPRAIEIDEIQHHDPAEITKAKARAAYEVIHEPVVVQDTSWSIPALGGFPGGYMKDIAGWWQPEDWIQIMDRHEDKTIHCHEHVAYFDGEQLQHFEHTYNGHFSDKPRGVKGNSIEQVACLYGDKTLAEGHDETEVASAGQDLPHWRKFGDWFTNQ